MKIQFTLNNQDLAGSWRKRKDLWSRDSNVNRQILDGTWILVLLSSTAVVTASTLYLVIRQSGIVWSFPFIFAASFLWLIVKTLLRWTVHHRADRFTPLTFEWDERGYSVFTHKSRKHVAWFAVIRVYTAPGLWSLIDDEPMKTLIPRRAFDDQQAQAFESFLLQRVNTASRPLVEPSSGQAE